MYKNTISLSGITAKLLKNPLLENISEDDILESALDCISLIGTPGMFIQTTSFLEIKKHRAYLPNDVVTLDSVRYVPNSEELDEFEYRDRVPMRTASDLYHISTEHTSEASQSGLIGLTYSVNGKMIYTSFYEGVVELLYTTLQSDEFGELLIPDDINVIKAVENYIIAEYLKPLWMMGKVADKVYNLFDREYCFYVAKAQTSTRELSVDERDALSNTLTTLLDNGDHTANFRKNLSAQEFRNRH